MGMRCDAFSACMSMSKKQKRCSDAKEEPDSSLNVHPAAEVLSQKRDAWLWVRLEVMHYSAIRLRTRPARLISFILRVPDVNISFTICGHSSCQMIGPIF